MAQAAFNWEPWDRTTVLLKDFSDYGNAGRPVVAQQRACCSTSLRCRSDGDVYARASDSSR